MSYTYTFIYIFKEANNFLAFRPYSAATAAYDTNSIKIMYISQLVITLFFFFVFVLLLSRAFTVNFFPHSKIKYEFD